MGRPTVSTDEVRLPSLLPAWIATDAAAAEATLAPDFFYFEQSWCAERARSNILLVHYANLKSDLAGEVRRIAAFLEIECTPDFLHRIAEAADFDAMRRDGARLLPNTGMTFEGGAGRFLFRGTNVRWRDLLGPDELAC